MHVHRVGVVDDMLPAADDVLPLGQEDGQQTDVVHHHERTHHPIARVEDAQERRDPGRIAAPALVHQGERLANQALGHPREGHIVILGRLEREQHAQGALSQVRGMGNLQVVTRQAEALLHLHRSLAPRIRRGHPGEALVDHEPRAGLDRAGVPIVVAHEALHGKVRVVHLEAQLLEAGLVVLRRLGDPSGLGLAIGLHRAIAQGLGHALLAVEAHLIVRAAGLQMQLVAHPPEEVEGRAEVLHLLLGEQSEVEEVVEVAQ